MYVSGKQCYTWAHMSHGINNIPNLGGKIAHWGGLFYVFTHFIYFSRCISVRVAFFVLVAWVFLVRNKCINFFFHGQLFSVRRSPEKWIQTFWISLLSLEQCSVIETPLAEDPLSPGFTETILASEFPFHLGNNCWSALEIDLSFHVPGDFWGCPKEPSLLLWDTMAQVLWGLQPGLQWWSNLKWAGDKAVG